MTLIGDITTQLIKHEGLRLKAYQCTKGYTTIGYGRNLDTKGIDKAEALYLLQNDITECIEDLRTIFENWHKIDDIRKKALVDMRFNLGPAGFRSFKKMIAAIKRNDYLEASKQMVDSVWYRQIGHRGLLLVRQMKSDFLM